MSKEAVIEIGSWTIKAGLWEQTFIPTTEIPSSAIIEAKDEHGSIIKAQCGSAVRDDPAASFAILDGQIVNYDLLAYLLRYILTTELGLSEPWNEVKVLLVIPAWWNLKVRSDLLKLLFETLGVGYAYLGDVPLMAAFGCALVNAIVVDIGHSTTDIGIVIDGELQKSTVSHIALGGRDIDEYLTCVIEDQAGSNAKFANRTDLLRRVRIAREAGLCDLSREDVRVDDAISLSQEDRAKAIKVLFEPHLLGPHNPHSKQLGIADLIWATAESVEPEKRLPLYDSIILTGLALRSNPAIRIELEKKGYLSKYLAASEYSADHQSKSFRVRTIPEYYPELWERATPVAAWFGGGITAKMVFPDHKAHYTRDEYIQYGKKLLLNKLV